jgi:hypothetical protein
MKTLPHVLQGRPAVASAARALVALLLLVVVTGCRIPAAEFGRMAEPIGVPELYAATTDCGGAVPWPALDRAHDEYFDAYWKLRTEIAAPMAAACIDAAGRPKLPSAAELEAFATQQQSLMNALAALDDHLYDAVLAAVPTCERQLREARSRRAIVRAITAFGSSNRALPVNLDAVINNLRLAPAQRDAVAPVMERYRERFATALTTAANAKFDIPRRWLKELEAQGLHPDDFFGPPPAPGETPKLSREDKRRILDAVAKASELSMDVELAHVDAVNDATVAEIAAADAATGQLLARALRATFIDARRRRMVFVAEAMLEIPAVQSSGMADRLRAYLSVEEAEARTKDEQDRARRAARTSGAEMPRGTDDRSNGPGRKPSKEVSEAAARVAAARQEFPDLATTMQALSTLTAPDRPALEERLSQWLPAEGAARIAALAPAAVIRADPVEETKPDEDDADALDEPSIPSGTYNLMHAGRFNASQRALLQRVWATPEGAQDTVRAALHDAEILESAAWQDLAAPLEQAEKKVDEIFLEEQPGIQQAMDQYASLARQTLVRLGASDDRLADALAAIHGAAAEDRRTAATRIFLASRRANLEWGMGPWDVSALVAPAACPRFDPVSAAMACSSDEATSTKALALASARAADWRTAMATATDAAIETVRTAVIQANSTDSDDFAEFMTTKAGASAMARLRDRVQPLRALQAELLQAIDAQCGPAAGRSATIAAARASAPDYYELTDPSTRGIERIARALDAADPARATVDAIRSAWITADGNNALQLMELLRSLEPLDIPSDARDVPTRRVTDAALARLVAERARAAERAARDAWLALPESARSPKGALGGTLRFR